MLVVNSLSFSYARRLAVQNIRLEARRGETVAIVGANGAGKTTLLRLLAGMLDPDSGSVELEGRDITNHDSHTRVANGIVLVPEGRQLFGPLTVRENLILGTYHRHRRMTATQLNDELQHVFQLFPVLKDRLNQRAKTLSGGEQQMVAIGRGLLANPKVLLLDEPSLGLAPKVKQQIFRVLRDLQQREDLTIIVVEQDVRLALRVASRGYVLQTGRIVASDTSENLLTNGVVRKSYLAVSDAEPAMNITEAVRRGELA